VFEKATGLEARRTEQYCGKAGDSDVLVDALPELHIEVKRRERLQLYDAVEQCVRDSKGNPFMLMHRRNSRPWLCIIPLDQLVAVAILLADKIRKRRCARPFGVPGDIDVDQLADGVGCENCGQLVREVVSGTSSKGKPFRFCCCGDDGCRATLKSIGEDKRKSDA